MAHHDGSGRKVSPRTTWLPLRRSCATTPSTWRRSASCWIARKAGVPCPYRAAPKLATAPQRFDEQTLRKAHKLRYGKALVDIISMVKHAARDGAPLLTATERVDRALAAVTAGRIFTPDQQRWLDRIRLHLVESLSLDLDDFDLIPVFTRDGGLTAASRAFGGALEQLVSDINAALAA